MMLVLVFFATELLLEVTAPYTRHVRHRHELGRIVTVSLAIGLLCALSMYFLATKLNLISVMIAVIGIYRTCNLLRILRARMHPAYLRIACWRTTVWLGGTQVVLIALWTVLNRTTIHTVPLWHLLAFVQCAAALAMLYTVYRHTYHASEPLPQTAYSHGELPTVTVAVAARNETESLAQCIESILSSDYPKLEIVVLDDCSQGRRTADIIRGFAHAGVRFIPGTKPKLAWLARNQAYQTLATAASGKYILFCSTSVRLHPESIRKLISYMLTKDKTMLSVMPRAQLAGGRGLLLEPLQAAWELLLPRRHIGRPPVLSSCWVIRTSALWAAGGFSAVSRMVIPEVFFAGKQIAHDGYSFAPGGMFYGVTSESTLDEQQSSLIRTCYPTLHRRPEMVALASFMLIIFGMLPFVEMFAYLFSGALLLVSVLGILSSCMLLLAYRQVLRLSYSSVPISSAAGFPLAAAAAIILHNYSMYRYEFGSVLWKERNICIPVMHVVSHLPNS